MEGDSVEENEQPGLIVITGEEHMRAVEAIRRLYYWRMQAVGHARGFTPPQVMTVKLFNAEYRPDPKCRTWADVARVSDELIKKGRGE